MARSSIRWSAACFQALGAAFVILFWWLGTSSQLARAPGWARIPFLWNFPQLLQALSITLGLVLLSLQLRSRLRRR